MSKKLVLFGNHEIETGNEYKMITKAQIQVTVFFLS